MSVTASLLDWFELTQCTQWMTEALYLTTLKQTKLVHTYLHDRRFVLSFFGQHMSWKQV